VSVLFCSNVLSSGRGGVEGCNRGPSLELLDTIDKEEDSCNVNSELLILVSAAILSMSRPLIELILLLLLLIIVGVGRPRRDRPIATAAS